MDVRLLGPIEVRVGDGPIELGPRKQRAVFAMLALEVGRTVSSDRLVEGLWAEQPPSSAAKMVQLYISHLRALLDGNGAQIVTRGRGYELQLDGEVDAVLAEKLVGESRAREALALWRGEPLADVADEPFAAGEIRRLDELRLRASESAIDADLAAGRHAEVIGELERLVAEEPLREHVRAQQMLALYRSGRQSDALAAYREARVALVEQIGVEPAAELRRLQDAILAQDSALDLPAPPEADAEVPSPRARPQRPAGRLPVAAAVLLLAGLTTFGVIRVLAPESLPKIDENAVGLIDPGGAHITAQYRVGHAPSAIAAGGGSVWIADEADGTVSRIDRKRDERVTIPVDGAPAALAFGSGSLWAADGNSRQVVQIDPGRNRVAQRIEVGNAPRALAVAAGAVWVASGVDGQLKRIDLARGKVTRSVAVGAIPSAIAAGAGALWVASEEAGTVTRIEPRTGAVVRTITVGNGPSSVATGEGAVWVANRYDGTLSRIDPATNSVSWTRGVGRDPTAVSAGEGAVWVAGGEQGTVARVDPDSGRVVKRRSTGSSPVAITVAGGSVWTAAVAPPAAHRGGTLRALVSRPSRSSIPINWLHPAAYTSAHTFQLSSLAYDGLVGYRRVEGAAGATIVGALATNVPEPSRDGRTYVFTLRRGVRFSDGRLVRPEDFRSSMERFLRVTRRAFPEFFSAIIGAHRCVIHPARCDLSAGIVTDARARTITIRLRRPDADLLHKLTLSFAYVVPADSPLRATPGLAPPGTGPYRVTAWDATRGGRFVRNPRFRPLPGRPDGFADRLEVDLPQDKTIEAQIAAVQRGEADVAVIANPFVSKVSPERLRALVAGSPDRVHSRPMPTTDWLFLNVREPPFDDPRVRKAVNFATDRARLVELSGGTDVGSPTCQILPAAFPAHEPYCPYTADPAVGRGWTARDMGRARRFVAQSGRAGARVVVWTPDYRREVGRYFVRLLGDLGFRASIHRERFDDTTASDSRSRVQAGFLGWAADYLSASNFMEPLFTCPPPGRRTLENLSRLCDKRLSILIARATATPAAEAAGAWAAADRRVTDLAAVVPMTNRRAVVLVSKRVGNVRHHAQFFTMLDQLWVH